MIDRTVIVIHFLVVTGLWAWVASALRTRVNGDDKRSWATRVLVKYSDRLTIALCLGILEAGLMYPALGVWALYDTVLRLTFFSTGFVVILVGLVYLFPNKELRANGERRRRAALSLARQNEERTTDNE